jgi:hypothetical protein
MEIIIDINKGQAILAVLEMGNRTQWRRVAPFMQ